MNGVTLAADFNDKIVIFAVAIVYQRPELGVGQIYRIRA